MSRTDNKMNINFNEKSIIKHNKVGKNKEKQEKKSQSVIKSSSIH